MKPRIDVYVKDVGHGACYIVCMFDSSGSVSYGVVDCFAPRQSHLIPSANPALAFFEGLKVPVDRLSFVALTHYDRDHFLGLADVICHFKTESRSIHFFFWPLLPPDEVAYARYSPDGADASELCTIHSLVFAPFQRIAGLRPRQSRDLIRPWPVFLHEDAKPVALTNGFALSTLAPDQRAFLTVHETMRFAEEMHGDVKSLEQLRRDADALARRIRHLEGVRSEPEGTEALEVELGQLFRRLEEINPAIRPAGQSRQARDLSETATRLGALVRDEATKQRRQLKKQVAVMRRLANQLCLAFRIYSLRDKSCSVLITGDIGGTELRRISERKGRLRCQALTVPHHGGNGSTRELLDKVAADNPGIVAGISCAAGDRSASKETLLHVSSLRNVLLACTNQSRACAGILLERLDLLDSIAMQHGALRIFRPCCKGDFVLRCHGGHGRPKILNSDGKSRTRCLVQSGAGSNQ